MSELVKIIDAYKDRHGQPSDASIARVIGVSSQTFDTWRNRGMKTAPRNKEPFRRLATFFGLPYDIIATAIAVDIGLLDEMPEYRWPDEGVGGDERSAAK